MILIKNATLCDVNGERLENLYIYGEKIVKNPNIDEKDCEVIDATGLVLMPSFADTHAHFREPGFEYKETIEGGVKSAVKGGFTTVNLMGNTKPVASSMEVVNYVLSKAKEVGMCDIHQCVSITKDFDGETLSHLDTLDDTVKCISEDGKWVTSNSVMANAMQKATEKGLCIMSHAEEMVLSKTDYRLAENLATMRDIMLAERYGTHLHMAHVSTKEAMSYIIDAKKRGQNVTCEVTPHHIWFYDKEYRVNPPIREKEDVEFLISAIKDGYVDCIGTDHAPHSDEDKAKGAPGMVGIEDAFAVCYTKLVKEGHINLPQLSKIMSYTPNKILGYEKGLLDDGYLADVVLVDLNKSYTISRDNLISKSKNTAFEGETVTGEVVMTIHRGKVVYKKGN